MKSKDQQLLEEAYQRVFKTYFLKEEQFPGDEQQFAQQYQKTIAGDYTQFVLWLKKYSDDERLKSIILTGQQDGNPQDDSLAGKEADIPVSNLYPTQQEIGIDNSLSYPLTRPDVFAGIFSSIVNPGPVIVLNGAYVLDGHHRWSQTYCYNPKAVLKVINYNNPNFNPQDGLKAIQAGIAALKTSKELKTRPNTDPNLLNCGDQEILDVLKPSEEVLAKAIQIGFCKDLQSFQQQVLKNVHALRQHVKGKWENNPKREVMPQPVDNGVSSDALTKELVGGKIQAVAPFNKGIKSQQQAPDKS
jgi:hypothetical protein